MTSWQYGLVFFEVKDSIHQEFHSLGYNISFYIYIPWDSVATIKTMGVNITTINYLKGFNHRNWGKTITIILLVVEAQGIHW